MDRNACLRLTMIGFAIPRYWGCVTMVSKIHIPKFDWSRSIKNEIKGLNVLYCASFTTFYWIR